jgi:hypothetical protein
MEVHFTPEQETQLTQIATKAGTDKEQLVKDTILRLIEDEISFRRPAPELSEWDLGTIGSLHRREETWTFWSADNFFTAKTIGQLIAGQGILPVHDLSVFAGAIPDEDLDKFVADIYRTRVA